jgi:hypothetical protein
MNEMSMSNHLVIDNDCSLTLATLHPRDLPRAKLVGTAARTITSKLRSFLNFLNEMASVSPILDGLRYRWNAFRIEFDFLFDYLLLVGISESCFWAPILITDKHTLQILHTNFLPLINQRIVDWIKEEVLLLDLLID